MSQLGCPVAGESAHDLRPDRPAARAALLRSTPQGATDYLQADLRDPGTILDRAAAVLDFGRPVAVILLGVLH